MSNKQQNKTIANSPRGVATATKIEITAQQTSFSGPIPHPETLKGYNEIVPGAAERILAMAERFLSISEKWKWPRFRPLG